MLWVQSYRKHNLETAIRLKPRQKGDMETPGSPLAYNGGTGTSAGRRACATRKIRASAVGAAGNRHSRQAQRVDGAHQAGGRQAHVLVMAAAGGGVFAPDGGGGFADARGREGGGGGEQAIHARPQAGELALHGAAQALRVDVIGGREQAALIEQGQHVVAESIALLQIWLQQGGGFGQQDDARHGVDGGSLRPAGAIS